jgi:hypothetical protein
LILHSRVLCACVSAIALTAGINANLLFKWWRDHLRAMRAPTGVAATLVPVQLAPAVETAPLATTTSSDGMDIGNLNGSCRSIGVVERPLVVEKQAVRRAGTSAANREAPIAQLRPTVFPSRTSLKVRSHDLRNGAIDPKKPAEAPNRLPETGTSGNADATCGGAATLRSPLSNCVTHPDAWRRILNCLCGGCQSMPSSNFGSSAELRATLCSTAARA